MREKKGDDISEHTPKRDIVGETDSEVAQEMQCARNKPVFEAGEELCRCTACGRITPNQAGIPCNQLRCPNCGEIMTLAV